MTDNQVIRFCKYTFEEQLQIIENSFVSSKEKFPQINNDIKNELMSFAEIENNFYDLVKKNVSTVERILNTLIDFRDENNELNRRKITQVKNNYWKVFDSFEVQNDKLIATNFIGIFLNTYYCMLYYEIVKYYQSDIIKMADYILGSLRGSLFDIQTKSITYTKLHKIDDFLDLRKGYGDYFFFQSLYLYGTFGIKKKEILKGFVNKMRNASLSAKREGISEKIDLLPKISMKQYL